MEKTMAKSDISTLSIDTIRLLSADAVQEAYSGHPGMPMGMAPVAYVLWTKILNYDPDSPHWPNRDRFILSAGHGSMLLYSILHLTGYDLPLEELKNFRQLGSRTPGHPEFHLEFGVETTTGPLGQGFSNGIGMALAAKHLAAVFNKDGLDLVSPNIYAIASDGDLMEGISHEAASLAGHLGLDNIIYIYDDNHISIEGDTDLAYSDDVPKRFESYGWHVQSVDDANDLDALENAFKTAKSVTGKPHLIKVRSTIGFGSPNQQDTAGVHGSPLGDDELKLTKKNLGFDPEKRFHIPDEVKEHFLEASAERKKAHQEWGKKLTEYKEKYPEEAAEFERRLSGEKRTLNDADLPVFKAEDGNIASRKASGKVIQAVAKQIPELIGGSADLAPSTKTLIDDSGGFSRDSYAERNLHFGVREHAMGGILNGMSLYRGVRPYGATFLIFSDYLRPTLRLAAMMGLPNIYVFTHDSIGIGEDGPTHQPIEHMSSLRAIPNILNLRPADANEVTQAWKVAVEQTDRPVTMALTRQGLPTFDREGEGLAPASDAMKGGYILKDTDGDPDVILLASGSEVQLAMGAAKQLADDGISARVVSMMSWELFDEQTEEYRASVLPDSVKKRLVVEAGRKTGWEKYAGDEGAYITMETYGASGPNNEVFAHFGFTVENIVKTVKQM